MLDLTQVLKSRLHFMEHYVKQGVIPGQLDTYELEQMIGRIKELKFVIAMLDQEIVSCDWLSVV